MRAPKWLPYRIRSQWDRQRVRFAIRHLNRTPAVRAAAAGASPVELHMLVCHRDVEIAVLAVKSLFRFLDSPIGITFTSDGSVTKRDRDWIDSHLVRIRWLGRHDCENDESLRSAEKLRALYHTGYHPICKLLHPVLSSMAERVIVLDPDTAFFKRPDRLISWIVSDGNPALFLHDHQDELRQVPEETREAFQQLRQLPVVANRQWNMPFYFFNSGLLAYRRHEIRFDIAEAYLDWRQTAPERFTTGKAGLWFGDWTPEQTCYQLLFATMKSTAEPLGDEYRIGGAPSFAFNHFLWLQLVEPRSLHRLARLVKAISQEHCHDPLD